MIYLDNAATTPVHPDVLDAMLPYLKNKYFNPSSTYNPALAVSKDIENARSNVAKLLNADPNEIFFTSCGSESNNWVIQNKFLRGGVLTSSIEHPSVLNNYSIYDKIPVDNNGVVDNNVADAYMSDSNVELCSIMMVNNEVGSVQPIKKLSEIAHKHGLLFHTDAVQAAGNMEINLKEMPCVDFLSISGHKIGAPKGIGALYIKKDVQGHISPLIYGGGQEHGFRSGTENVAGIVGLGEAARIALRDFEKNTTMKSYLMHILEHDLLHNIDDIKINSMAEQRTHILNVSFKNIDGESLMILLGKDNIYVSTGSACHSKSTSLSHTLTSMNVPKEYIGGTIRISIGNHNTEKEIRFVAKRIKENVELLRKYKG